MLNRVNALVQAFWGSNGLFSESRLGSKTVLGSFHVVEQLLFLMFTLIMTFEFGLILGSFF